MAANINYVLATRMQEVRLNDVTQGHQFLSEIVGLSNGGFAVVYKSFEAADDVYPVLEIFDSGFNRVVSATLPAGPGATDLVGSPEVVQLADGNIAVVWQEGGDGENELLGAIFDAETGAVVRSQFTVSPLVGDGDPETAALANGNWAVAFSDGNGISVQVMDASGGAVGAAVVTPNAGYLDPAVTPLSGGGFVVTYTDTAFDANEIHAQIYNNAGLIQQADLTIAVTGANTASAVAALPNGNWAVVYADSGWSGDGLTLQIFGADGNALSGFIRVDKDFAAVESDPDITVLENGFIVVTWTHPHSEGDSDIFAAVYDMNGAQVPVGASLDPVQIASTNQTETDASVAAIVGGLFGVSYTDGGGDGDGTQVSGVVRELVRHTTGDDTSEVLNGDILIDKMRGNGGDDTLNGAGGDDGLVGGAGADDIDGGEGVDLASYTTSNAGVVVSLALGSASGGDAQGDILTSIEDLYGSGFDDTLTGDNGANDLGGSGGDDTLNGLNGDDELGGEAGEDWLTGGLGADILDGGAENDWVNYSNSGDAVQISLHDDAAQGGHANGDDLDNIENLFGSQFDDVLTGHNGVNVLNGFNGADVLSGLGGADQLIGGGGVDTADYSASTSAVTANLNTGQGYNGYAEGDTYSSIENVVGSQYNDFLFGHSSVNSLEGGLGDDFLQGYGGGDALVGGVGTDTASYIASGGGVTVNLLNGLTAGGHAGGDTFGSIENLIGSNFADILTGTTGANVLHGAVGEDSLNGSNGDDALEGGNGDDILIGGAGADNLYGGDQRDTASYVTSNAQVSINLAMNTASGGHADGDVFIDVENLLGSNYADNLVGDVLNNVIDGYNGNDDLDGREGADTLRGGNGVDRAVYAHSDQAVVVNLMTGQGSGGHAAGDTLVAIEDILGSLHNDVLTGTTGDNTIGGFWGNDEINASNGDDLVYGGDGDDSLVGGAGADLLDGDLGIDTAWYANSNASVNINLATNVAAGGHAQGDTFASIEWVGGSSFDDTITGDGAQNLLGGGQGNDTLNGGGNGDLLVGETGNDVLLGGVGNDTLIGGVGDDVLSGYLGSDVFTFDIKHFGDDIIIGFENGVDMLHLGNGLTFADFVETAAGPGTLLTYEHNGAEHTITILGVAPGLIDATDFIV